MAKVKFVPRASGFRDILTSSGVESDMMRRAEAVANTARGAAPIDSGEYAAEIEAFTERHPTRVVAHVWAHAPHSMVVEASTGNLASSLDAAAG